MLRTFEEDGDLDRSGSYEAAVGLKRLTPEAGEMLGELFNLSR